MPTPTIGIKTKLINTEFLRIDFSGDPFLKLIKVNMMLRITEITKDKIKKHHSFIRQNPLPKGSAQ